MLTVLYCTLALVPLVLGGTTPHALTSLGSIIGRVLKSRDGRGYDAYTGIPFAKPPVGPLRFMAPEPTEKWKGFLDATKSTPVCYQASFNGEYRGDEDCLYLDVYVPHVKTNKPLPVIFSIYGGGFVNGGTEPPKTSRNFMDEDIILVEPHYRVGALGFLSLEDDEMPGNMGLKDQALALEWVSREISSFGGDPKRITVIGESAGGASSHLICSALRTTGLIKACISQSGEGWAKWAFQAPGTARSKALVLAKSVGCTDQLLKCLQSKPARDVTNLSILPSLPSAISVGPVLEPVSAAGALFTHWPTGANDFPWITGVTHDEGLLFTGHYEYFQVSEEQIDEYIKNFDKILSGELNLQNNTNGLKRIKERFFKEDVKPLIAIRNLYTEMLFVLPALKALSYHKGPKYFYHFNYAGGPTMANTHNVSGVSHGAEMPFFFDDNRGIHPAGWPSPNDLALSKLLVKMWANLAIYQAPSDASFWPTFDNGSYLYIDNSEIVQKEFTQTDEILNFWKDLL